MEALYEQLKRADLRFYAGPWAGLEEPDRYNAFYTLRLP
jgi:hypothetical protein